MKLKILISALLIIFASGSAFSQKRDFHILGSAGGWEIDYTTNNYSLGFFLGWNDQHDFYTNYSMIDKVYYRRSNLTFDAFWFFQKNTYLQIGAGIKNYDYPFEINPDPDNSSYDQVPTFQIEYGNYFFDENYFNLGFEYFRPNFYWDENLRANNFKFSGSIRYWLIEPFYGKFYLAFLHDPDPETFVINKQEENIYEFSYQQQFLAGGAIGLSANNLNLELKYLPNRDLDNSITHSIFTKIKYTWNHFGGPGTSSRY